MRLLLLALLIGACARPAPDTESANAMTSAGATDPAIVTPLPAPVAQPSATPVDFTGRWIGVEGMYLVVTSAGADRYSLEMQYDLDHKQTANGRETPTGIAFERDGKSLLLKPSDGKATGLKYLAGKKDCLTVALGEGYCRG